jgi:acetyl esterase/lipase
VTRTTALLSLVLVGALVGVACSTTPVTVPVSTAPATTTLTTTTLTTTTLTTTTPGEPVLVADDHAAYRYGPAEEHLLDVFPPTDREGDDRLRPALVVLHGGGWVAGGRSDLADFVTEQLDRGWYVVAVGYRLAPAHIHPAPDEDVDRSLRWLAATATALGIDPASLVLLGTSAGGQLALTYAADPDRFVADDLPPGLVAPAPGIAGVVGVAAPGDLVPLYAQASGPAPAAVGSYLGCADACTEEELRAASPITMVRPTPPPALLLYGEFDPLVPVDVQGYPLAAVWEAAGGEVTVVVAEGQTHNLGFDAGIDRTTFNGWLDTVVGR